MSEAFYAIGDYTFTVVALTAFIYLVVWIVREVCKITKDK